MSNKRSRLPIQQLKLFLQHVNNAHESEQQQIRRHSTGESREA
jgi:hypothetical protein